MSKATYRFPLGEMSDRFTDFLNSQGVRYSTRDEDDYLLFTVYNDTFRINKFARKLEFECMLEDCNTKDFKASIRDKNRRSSKRRSIYKYR